MPPAPPLLGVAATTTRCGMPRSQVNWRLASWRVAAMPRSRTAARNASPDRPSSERGPGLPGSRRSASTAGRRAGRDVRAARAPRRGSPVRAWHRSAPRMRACSHAREVGSRGDHRRRLRRARRRVEARQRAAADAKDLERAADALRVGGRQARGARRVDAGEFGVQGRPAAREGLGFERSTHRRVGGGAGRRGRRSGS